MKSLTKVLAFMALGFTVLIGSCDDWATDPNNPANYRARLLYIDSSGAISLHALPEFSMDITSIQGIVRLADGSAILVGNNLYLWKPGSEDYTNITPQDFQVIPHAFPISASQDGSSIYYTANDNICKMNTSDFSQEVLVDSLGWHFWAPRISNDGRYLGFIGGKSFGHYFPMYMDMITKEIVSLKSDNSSRDDSSRDILVDTVMGKIFYAAKFNSDFWPALCSMNIDGSSRALLTSLLRHTAITYDHKYLVPYYCDDCYFRNNLTQTWYHVINGYANGTSLAANVIYYCDTSTTKMFKYNMDTSSKTLVLDNPFCDETTNGIFNISPAADGSSVVAVVRFDNKH